MSDIPKAREMLNALLARALDPVMRDTITQAVSLMTRKKPEFVVRKASRKLTDADKATAIAMRSQGRSMNSIAVALGTNLGRISEACAS